MSIQQTINYRRRGDIGRLTLHGIADIFEASEIHDEAVKALGDLKAATIHVDPRITDTCGIVARVELPLAPV